MAAARSEKISPGLGARGFSLVEVLVAVAVLSVLYGCLFLSGSRLLQRFSDPYSDENIAREVSRATAWLDDQIYRATTAGRNFELIAPANSPTGVLSVKWQGVRKSEEWRSGLIGMRTYRVIGTGPAVFRYDWRAQTLTPALTLRVFKQKDRYSTAAGWFIIISGNGLTRASKTAP